MFPMTNRAMNIYIAALAIRIDLMAHSPALAEVLEFKKSIGAPLEDCIMTSKKGYEVSKMERFKGKNVITEYLIHGLRLQGAMA